MQRNNYTMKHWDGREESKLKGSKFWDGILEQAGFLDFAVMSL